MRTTKLLAISGIAGLAVLTGCGHSAAPTRTDGSAGPVGAADPTTTVPTTTGPVDAAPVRPAPPKVTPTSSAPTSSAPTSSAPTSSAPTTTQVASHCPVGADTLMIAASRAGLALEHLNAEPVYCAGGYATSLFIHGAQLFHYRQGAWSLVRGCPSDLPASIRAHVSYC